MPGYNPTINKPGRKPGSTSLVATGRLPRWTDAEILDYKYEMLKLMEEGVAQTITEAARQIGISPTRAYHWAQSDPDFREMIESVRQVVADRLERELGEHANFIPKMMILKGYRPMFREAYNAPTQDSRAQEIVATLLEIAKKAQNKNTE